MTDIRNIVILITILLTIAGPLFAAGQAEKTLDLKVVCSALGKPDPQLRVVVWRNHSGKQYPLVVRPGNDGKVACPWWGGDLKIRLLNSLMPVKGDMEVIIKEDQVRKTIDSGAIHTINTDRPAVVMQIMQKKDSAIVPFQNKFSGEITLLTAGKDKKPVSIRAAVRDNIACLLPDRSDWMKIGKKEAAFKVSRVKGLASSDEVTVKGKSLAPDYYKIIEGDTVTLPAPGLETEVNRQKLVLESLDDGWTVNVKLCDRYTKKPINQAHIPYVSMDRRVTVTEAQKEGFVLNSMEADGQTIRIDSPGYETAFVKMVPYAAGTLEVMLTPKVEMKVDLSNTNIDDLARVVIFGRKYKLVSQRMWIPYGSAAPERKAISLKNVPDREVAVGFFGKDKNALCWNVVARASKGLVPVIRKPSVKCRITLDYDEKTVNPAFGVEPLEIYQSGTFVIYGKCRSRPPWPKVREYLLPADGVFDVYVRQGVRDPKTRDIVEGFRRLGTFCTWKGGTTEIKARFENPRDPCQLLQLSYVTGWQVPIASP